MSDSEKFRRQLQKRAAARAKQTQSAAPVKVKAPAAKVPIWQGCLVVALAVIVISGMVLGLLYKTQYEPILDNMQLTVTAILATNAADQYVIKIEAACFVHRNLTASRCREKAIAALQEDYVTAAVCANISDTRSSEETLECLSKRGLWD